MKKIITITIVVLLIAIALSLFAVTRPSTETNKKLCQRYSKDYNITICDNQSAQIWLKKPNPGDGSRLVNLSNFSEIICGSVNPDYLNKKCLEKSLCLPITCN